MRKDSDGFENYRCDPNAFFIVYCKYSNSNIVFVFKKIFIGLFIFLFRLNCN